MARRPGLMTLGTAVALFGVLLPCDWYEPLDLRDDLAPPPFSGALLLQAGIVATGLLLLALGFAGWRWCTVAPDERALVSPPREATSRGYLVSVFVVSVVGLGLRLLKSNTDMWLDEIAPLLQFNAEPIVKVWISYSPSNHLLNALLVKASTGLLGEDAWTVRLPAILFGAAAVPVLYWMPGAALPRRVRLAAAALLALSYHHVFFSQNARGYTAYLCFALASTGFFVRAAGTDAIRTWSAWAAVSVLGLASHLLFGFVLAGQALTGLTAVLVRRARREPHRALLRRLFEVFAVPAIAGFLVYSVVVPQAWVQIRGEYTSAGAGHQAFSAGFLRQFAEGLAGSSTALTVLLVLPALAIGSAGFVALLRRCPHLVLALTLPTLVQLTLVVSRGLAVQPRLFLLVLPVALLACAAGLDAAARTIGTRLGWDRRRQAVACCAAAVFACAGSALLLPRNYSRPKQAYRAAIEWLVRDRKPGDTVVVVHLAYVGMEYYGRSAGFVEGRDFVHVRTIEAFEEALARRPAERVVLVTTLPQILAAALPELAGRVERDWVEVRRFEGTIGGGDISILARR